MAANANSLGGVNLTVLAQETLPVLQAKLAPLSFYTTNFSADVATKGSGVVTRFPTAMTAANYARATGYNALEATSSAVTVNLDKHKHYTVGFDDSEVGNAGLSTLQNLFIQPAVFAIVNAVQSDVFALITTAFPAVHSASYADLGYAGITLGAKVLDFSGSIGERSVILGPNAYYDVLDDIKGLYSVDSSVLRDAKAGKIADTNVAMVGGNYLGGRVNSLGAGFEGLAGFYAAKPALCLAARLPSHVTGQGIQVENVIDPNTGFGVQLRQWYSPDEGQWKISAIALYGVARGLTSHGVRILTTN